ncbi:Translation initiation factor eIF-2B subunit delta [Cyphomyrmex costatus]|uniref:Translation initiation factor eIF2B subunit delta n=1 Tax=Cyphomyrmex costatus TaxID=456900 RepID=A0A151IIK6_9HYME|nr:Translation initiation factor eIF-2B subunit delta [Cyphomyrmex costatus]
MSLPKSNEKPNLSQKTREEIKAEREAKKTAKAAAKAAKINNDKIDDVKNVGPANLADCKILKKDTQANVAVDTTISSLTNALKENAIQSLNVQNSVSESKNEGGKSKAQLRAERRVKQEAQRAVKQQQLAKDNIKSEESLKPHIETVSECPVKKSVVNNAVRENAHTVNLFKHLYQERERSLFNIATVNSNIHPAIVRLGVQYANKVIVGSNARCVALLAAVKQMIQDFEKPIHEDFIRGLEANLKESLKYLCHCRPLGVSMHNAMRHLTWQMTQFSSTLSDEKAKSKLQGMIDTYISEQIQLADKAISLTIQSKISNGNVILTYGYSSLIHKILVEAHSAGKQFRVVVVDGRPWLEGKEQLRRLAKHGIECSYILINALSFIMPEVSKVFLGAHAILANGAVMSRVGTAQVALMAKAFNVPVLVACETHKSSERVQTDSIVHNELGNADDLVNHQSNGNSKKSLLSNWRTKKSLNLLNITYDVTPADLVTAVVTELAILPCTSVPVILRIKPSEV